MTKFLELGIFEDIPNFYWTIEKYHAIIDAGVLDENDQVELLFGKIVPMSPVGHAHTRCVAITERKFSEEIDDSYLIWTQSPITINNNSEPEPDISIVRNGLETTKEHKPYPEDIALVVEVSDSTLRYDRNTKRAVYAIAGIQEYWIIDVYGQSVEQHLSPQEDGTYATINKFGKQDEIVSLELGSYLVSDLLA